MKSIKCLYCCNLIDKNNQSVEHIIPNVFGGKVKSSQALCKDCNSKLGSSIDIELANMFEFQTAQIKPLAERKTRNRCKGFIEDIQVVFNKNKIETPYRPNIVKNENGSTSINGVAYFTDEKEKYAYLEQAYKTIKGLSKNKEYTFQEFQNQIITNKIQPIIKINPTFKLASFILGYLKILLCFCAEKRKLENIAESEILEPFRKNNSKYLEQYASFCNLNHLHNGRLCHRIYIVGDSQNQKLFGIVALYDTFPMIFMLNLIYQGESFLEGYCYDILNHKEIQEEQTFLIEGLKLEKLFQTHCEIYEQMINACKPSMEYFMNFIISPKQQDVDELFFSLAEFVGNKYLILKHKENNEMIFDFLTAARKDNKKLFSITDEEFYELVNFIYENQY